LIARSDRDVKLPAAGLEVHVESFTLTHSARIDDVQDFIGPSRIPLESIGKNTYIAEMSAKANRFEPRPDGALVNSHSGTMLVAR
jgi:hypothetical protein